MNEDDLSDDPTDEEIEAYLETLDTTCALCGKETYGAAAINEKFYCHQDEGVTCYMRASWEGSTP